MSANNEGNYLDKECHQKRPIISFSNLMFIFQWNIELFFAAFNMFGSVLFAIFIAVPSNILIYLIKEMIDDDQIRKP